MVYVINKYNKIVLLAVIVTSTLFLYLINYYEPYEKIHFIKSTNEDIYDLLIDYKGFEFVINPRACWNILNDQFTIVTVPSSPDNIDFRNAIRTTWGRWDDEMKVVFFLGLPEFDIENVTADILLENDMYGDIVQGNFIDSLQNHTYKHVMILKWVAHHCADAKFVVKVDDNAIIDLHRIYDLLEENKWGQNDVMVCYVHYNSPVVRTYGSYNISRQEFAEERYPPYCTGTFIIYSLDVVFKLLEVSRRVAYYVVDDFYVTGLLAKEIGIEPVNLELTFVNNIIAKKLLNSKSNLRLKGPLIIGPVIQQPHEIRKYWSALLQYHFRYGNIQANERKITKVNTLLLPNQ